MSDTSSKDQRALHYNSMPPHARQPKPAQQVWRLRDSSGRVQSCQLRDNTRARAGWDVMLLENGEPLFSRRCSNEREARYVAEAFKQDTMRGGWTEA
jgi:hypothetical protein